MATKYFDADTNGVVTTAANWNGDAVPAANDDVRFDANEFDTTITAITGDLDNTVSSVFIGADTTQDFGTSDTPLAWNIGGTGDNIFTDHGTGDKYFTLTDWVTWNIYAGGTMAIRGTTGSTSTLTIRGEATISAGEDLATALEADNIYTDEATVTLGTNVKTNAGANGSSLAVLGGTVYSYATLGTVYVYGGDVYLYEGAWTTAYVCGGTVYVCATGTPIATLTVRNGGAVDFSEDGRGKTITTCYHDQGGEVQDPYGCVTWTNAVQVRHGSLTGITVDWGKHKKYTIADI